MSHSEKQIFELLRVRSFSRPEYIFMGQVASASGVGAARYMDAVALSLWPSRGIRLHAIEIKVDRRDWLREKKDPAKAEAIARFAHQTWLVVDGDARRPVVEELDEVPPAWGLLEVHEQKNGSIIKRRRQAIIQVPEAPTWAFIAAVMRRAVDAEDAQREEIVAGIVRERVSKADGRRKDRHSDELTELRDLQRRVKEFERTSGVNIEYGTISNIGRAVNMLTSKAHGDGVERWFKAAVDGAEARLGLLRRCQEEIAEYQQAVDAVCGAAQEPK